LFFFINSSISSICKFSKCPSNDGYAGTFPVFIYALFGSSRYLSVGPVSIISILTLTGISKYIIINDHNYVELVIILALMVGIVQIVMGIYKFGYLLQYISPTVIEGFVSAFALIIIANQLPTLLGIKNLEYSNLFSYSFKLLINLPNIHYLTTLILALQFNLLYTPTVILLRNKPQYLFNVVYPHS